jgi:uncharacterized protein YcaQ
VLLKKRELPLVEDLVQAIVVAGCPTFYCLREDLPLLEKCRMEGSTVSAGTPIPSPPLRLLAPLDPLIYDRRVTSALWNFNYTWEVYTPQARRVRGYYALPVLAGTELIGHFDPRADRQTRRLHIVSRSIKRRHKTKSALDELALFLGLRR